MCLRSRNAPGTSTHANDVTQSIGFSPLLQRSIKPNHQGHGEINCHKVNPASFRPLCSYRRRTSMVTMIICGVFAVAGGVGLGLAAARVQDSWPEDDRDRKRIGGEATSY
jgi:hypothetical protein